MVHSPDLLWGRRGGCASSLKERLREMRDEDVGWGGGAVRKVER